MKIEEIEDFLWWYWLEDLKFDDSFQVVLICDRRNHLFYQIAGLDGDCHIPREEWDTYRVYKIEKPKR